MSRYTTTFNIKDDKGISRKSTTILPAVPSTPQDVFIVTTSPERLDKLAYTFYGDSTLWWVIAAANGLGRGTFIIAENTNIRIPAQENIIDILIQVNDNR